MEAELSRTLPSSSISSRAPPWLSLGLFLTRSSVSWSSRLILMRAASASYPKGQCAVNDAAAGSGTYFVALEQSDGFLVRECLRVPVLEWHWARSPRDDVHCLESH